MKTHNPTPQEMLTRVARFKDLKSVKEKFKATDGIPTEAY
jgi:hypothetical protein